MGRTKLGQKGRLMVPSAVQQAVHISEGTPLVIRAVEDGVFVVETVDAVKARMRAAAPVPSGGWDAAADARADVEDEQATDARTDHDTEEGA